MKQFSSPLEHLGGIDAGAFARLAAVASDIALVIDNDEQGSILDISLGSEELAREMDRSWIGKSWLDVVTTETRSKVRDLLKDATSSGMPRWRQINHSIGRLHDLPVMYTAIRLGKTGPTMAIGRSLQPLITLQTQLVESQQAMDREYLRLRQQETRHRLLFQVSDEAVMVIDAATHRIIDSNPAAIELLDDGSRKLVGRTLDEILDAGSRATVGAVVSSVIATGRQQDVPVSLQTTGKGEQFLHVALFREGSTRFLLLRMLPVSKAAAGPPRDKLRVMGLVDQAVDAFVVTDTDGRIQFANAAFLDAAQLGSPEQLRGETLERWLGRPGVDFNLLASQLREHGTVRLFATTLQGSLGVKLDVEICAVSVTDRDETCYGFTLREVGLRKVAAPAGQRDRPRSVDQLASMVGRVPLKDLVRESTDLIEKLCIEAALELTGDNRASAAEVLGLSRQSLYAKLRRYGLGDLDGAEEPEAG